jgi:hypothetical protein
MTRKRFITSAMILAMLAIVCYTGVAVYAALTKTTAMDGIDAWQNVAFGTCVVGNAEDISTSYSTLLYIQAVPTTAAVQLGMTIDVYVSYGTTNWVKLTGFTTSLLTGATTTTAGALTDANSIVDLTDATTAHFDHLITRWFILDAADVTKSEVVMTKAGLGGHVLTLASTIQNAHTTGRSVYTGVEEWVVQIPFGVSQIRTVVNNTDADCTMHFRTWCSKVTAIQ